MSEPVHCPSPALKRPANVIHSAPAMSRLLTISTINNVSVSSMSWFVSVACVADVLHYTTRGTAIRVRAAASKPYGRWSCLAQRARERAYQQLTQRAPAGAVCERVALVHLDFDSGVR